MYISGLFKFMCVMCANGIYFLPWRVTPTNRCTSGLRKYLWQKESLDASYGGMISLYFVRSFSVIIASLVKSFSLRRISWTEGDCFMRRLKLSLFILAFSSSCENRKDYGCQKCDLHIILLELYTVVVTCTIILINNIRMQLTNKTRYNCIELLW